ncbi:LysR family transcriptional regulator [Thauera linaloolentis]|uniref:LysR family transcriptional regulator n=1 Tax=Thauera linaloolentis (strain DSM 12138 / JCM 21573 / CCUG 41526 / CIP 105981 / IAM 15112 / NBRC 102519 / 47Lol) TaxID=1123367 RepID=N6Z2Y1_THAL4|nr:LysR family transcriptional regulator [Thauera linaloolentis]ENO86514.1 LysR family transcriptional regulator [Thauera linaloolentis 47Lol = DSM 12138]MCM8566499.1 LysR family transcriptional regulator [Thauera linaloolentis]
MEDNKNPLLHWDDARVFLAITRNGTLSGAAIALAMGVATVSRRLDRLEGALGVPLFSRHQSGYRLTDDGGALLERAEALEHAGHAFGYAAQQQRHVAGCVRLATAENLANPLIIPSLPQLFATHPGLRVEIVSAVQTVNLHRRDADLAVRMVKPEAGNITIKRLGTLGFGLYGSRGYVEARRGGADAGAFVDDDFIGWAEPHGHLPAAKWLARMLRDKPCRVETNTLSAQLSATTAGLGLAVLPHYLARQADLVCLLPELGADQPIWLVLHADLAHSRRVRAVADHLIQLFEDRKSELDPLPARTP